MCRVLLSIFCLPFTLLIEHTIHTRTPWTHTHSMDTRTHGLMPLHVSPAMFRTMSSPWEPIAPFYSHYEKIYGASIKGKYASMIANMDMNIGRLLACVDSLGIAENTLIMFTSDNGPENDAGSAGGFKGQKRLLAEGGIRVPFIAQWKGRIQAGAISDKFAITTDIFPTFLNAAKVNMHHNLPPPTYSYSYSYSLFSSSLSSSSLSSFTTFSPQRHLPPLYRQGSHAVAYTH